MMTRTSADAAFSDFIRARDRHTCQVCGVYHGPNSFWLHASHLWKRGNSTYCVRFDEDNAMAACNKCHDTLEANPALHHDFFVRRLGPDRYDALKRRAHEIVKRSAFDLREIAARFRRKAAALGYFSGRGPALSTFVPGPVA